MGKHILVISQYFYPESFRINDICQEWVKRGHKVTVLTGIPNYPEGKFYKGYGWFKKRKETWNGIDIIRIPLISRGHSTFRLVLNYYSFVISGWFWKVFTKLKPDMVFTFEVSPMTQALIGKWFSKKRKIPNYLYVQDLWPENLEVVGGIHNKHILKHYQKMSDKIYSQCTKILATSPSFVKTIQERVKDKEKVVYWPQYAEEIYKPVENPNPIEIPKDSRFKIIFTGNVGVAQGLDILPKAARMVEDVLFVIVGNGRYKKQLMKDVEGVEDKFLFIDRQPAERIPELLCACDMAFVSFMNNPLFEKTIPAKLQSYMACGMPILAAASGETKRIIEEAKCGMCCEIGNPDALSDCINALKKADCRTMGNNSKEYFSKHFKKEELMDNINTLIEL